MFEPGFTKEGFFNVGGGLEKLLGHAGTAAHSVEGIGAGARKLINGVGTHAIGGGVVGAGIGAAANADEGLGGMISGGVKGGLLGAGLGAGVKGLNNIGGAIDRGAAVSERAGKMMKAPGYAAGGAEKAVIGGEERAAANAANAETATAKIKADQAAKGAPVKTLPETQGKSVADGLPVNDQLKREQAAQDAIDAKASGGRDKGKGKGNGKSQITAPASSSAAPVESKPNKDYLGVPGNAPVDPPVRGTVIKPGAPSMAPGGAGVQPMAFPPSDPNPTRIDLPRIPPAGPAVQQPSPPLGGSTTVGGQAQAALTEFGQGASRNSWEPIARDLAAGTQVRFVNPQAVVAAKRNPNWNVIDHAEGGVQVIGVRDPNTGAWHGTPSSPAQNSIEQSVREASVRRVHQKLIKMAEALYGI
jgi:hypothetical protein